MLLGRALERQKLVDLLDEAMESHSGAIVVRGQPGAGKSALLRSVASDANGFRVLSAIGVPSESELPYAGVHQLVWPMLSLVDHIPAPQQAALRRVAGLEESSGNDDRFLVGAAILSLLAVAAEERPLLCLVDDAHWLDQASADALTFTARRLEAERIAMIFAARDSAQRTFEAPGLAELRIRGLSDEAASQLLDQRLGGELSEAVRNQLIRATGGNPLALIEVPTALTQAQLDGREPIGSRLPVTQTVEKVFLDRIRALPEAAQTLMLLAAADDTGESAVVLEAASRLGVDIGNLDPVEASGLLRVDGQSVIFRHSLVRAAVYQSATFSKKRAVHDALSTTLQNHPRYEYQGLWHRAAATPGLDDALASELDASSEAALSRGGHVAAGAALERAAALTSDQRLRASRLIRAAWAYWLGGRRDAAEALVEHGERHSQDVMVDVDAAHLSALMQLQCGSPAEGHDILMNAASRVEATDPFKAGDLLIQAGEAANFAGDLRGEIAAGRWASRLRKGLHGPQMELTMMAGVADLLESNPRQGVQLLRDALTLVDSSSNPRKLSWAGSAAYYVGDLELALAHWHRFVKDNREQGAVSMLAVALAYQAYGEVLLGRTVSARVDATEGLRLATETGQDNCVALHRAILARAAARAGDEADCRSHVSAVLEAAASRELGFQAGNCRLALAELHLASGRDEEAIADLEAAMDSAVGVSSVSVKLVGAPDLVEAVVRAGDRARAVEVLERYESWVTGTGSRFEAPLVSRCRALLAATPEAAAEHFEDALRLHEETEVPFDLAKTEMLYGEALRRRRRPKEARQHLRAAYDRFDRLGARLWAARAGQELRASGGSAPAMDGATAFDQLTAQELQIARMVATGAANKEVAAQLFLSPRTVEFHLRHVYAKLSVRSRAELAHSHLLMQRLDSPA